MTRRLEKLDTASIAFGVLLSLVAQGLYDVVFYLFSGKFVEQLSAFIAVMFTFIVVEVIFLSLGIFRKTEAKGMASGKRKPRGYQAGLVVCFVIIVVLGYWGFTLLNQINSLNADKTNLQNQINTYLAWLNGNVTLLEKYKTWLSGNFTRFEKLEFTSAYAVYNATSGKFDIRIRIRNTGSANATIDLVFLNGKPYNGYSAPNTPTVTWSGSTTLTPSAELWGTVSLLKGDLWKSGMTVELMIQTVRGNQYPKSITLP